MYHLSTPSPPPKVKKKLATRTSSRSRNQEQYVVYNCYSTQEGLTLVGYRKAQEEFDSQASEEENIPAVETMTVTPKKKGVK